MQGIIVHITGRVQGVGFRPFVFLLANDLELKGTVRNTKSGVIIELSNMDDLALPRFLNSLKRNAPDRAIIHDITYTTGEVSNHTSFHIIESDADEQVNVKVSPDFALCEHCRTELLNENNRRFHYAFTTCSVCGPRYSILKEIPYDREHTTMRSFDMCEPCAHEYEDPSNRRFYSQTNSCVDCGVQMHWFSTLDGLELDLSQQEIIEEAIVKLQEGKILAVKGIGGYLLLCDATNISAVSTLRQRKQRPEKPFALLYASSDLVSKDAYLPKAAEFWLKNEVSPIVLLKRKASPAHPVDWEGVAPGLDHVGVMIPYAPLLQILSDKFSKPMVATSANISGGSIIFEDEQAQQQLFSIADIIITHEREIIIPQDDSVLKFAGSQPIWYRRSRGLAPSYYGPTPSNHVDGVLALGAHLKGSFAFTQNSSWHVSQYLGNLDGYESRTAYQHSLNHLLDVFNEPINVVLTDMHPTYFTHEQGKAYAATEDADLLFVQHHEAHFASVLLENDLLDADEQILGVIWDGTGYGTDGHIWGGEFFLYQKYGINRVAHLNYKPLIGNDKMAQEPRISLLSFSNGLSESKDQCQERFSELEWHNYQQLSSKSQVLTSSMGRLFDAVASLLGVLDVSSYEGQAAMLLEQLASSYDEQIEEVYPMEIEGGEVNTDLLLKGIANDLHRKIPTNKIAHTFHLSLVELIRLMAEKQKIKSIAFSGGVFQNALLVKLILQKLGDQYQLFFQKELSPNDENISFGQLAHYHISLKKSSLLQNLDSTVTINPDS